MRRRIGGAGVLALILLAACEPTVAPEPRLAPEPARTGFLRTEADIDAALRALHPGQPIRPADREAVRLLVAMMDRTATAPIPESSSPPSVPASVERALRDFSAADGDVATITQILQRLAAERSAETR